MKSTLTTLLLAAAMLVAAVASNTGWAQSGAHDSHAGHTGQAAADGQPGNGSDKPMQNQGDDQQARMQQRQGGMMQQGQGDGQGSMMQNGEMMQHMEHMRSMMAGMSGGQGNNAGGQDAFSAIRAVVSQLEASPDTDWSTINIDALRAHLIDMNELTLNAAVTGTEIEGGASYRVTGSGRTLDAIRRMVPAHAAQISTETEWTAQTREVADGVVLTVTADSPDQVIKLRALGFMGFMVAGEHHEAHHLAIVGAEAAAHSANGAGHSH